MCVGGGEWGGRKRAAFMKLLYHRRCVREWRVDGWVHNLAVTCSLTNMDMLLRMLLRIKRIPVCSAWWGLNSWEALGQVLWAETSRLWKGWEAKRHTGKWKHIGRVKSEVGFPAWDASTQEARAGLLWVQGSAWALKGDPVSKKGTICYKQIIKHEDFI